MKKRDAHKLRLDPSSRYKEHLVEGSKLREVNDCGVRALAAVTGRPYAAIHHMVAQMGRKHRSWTPLHAIDEVLRFHGLKQVEVDPRDIIEHFPGRHSQKLYITSHSPDRFPKAWPAGRYLMYTNRGGHVLAIIDGVNQDWSRGRSLRCWCLMKIIPR